MMTAEIDDGYLVQHKAGTKIGERETATLKAVSDELENRGYTVLPAWTRTPGFMVFFTQAYRYELCGKREFHGIKLSAPMGVVRVAMQRNGGVVVTVMGCEFDSAKSEPVELKWK